MATLSKLNGTGQTASSVIGAAFHLVHRTVASLGVWMLPIVVAALTAAALCGSLSLHRGSAADRDQVTIDGEKPFSIINVYYSRDYTKVVMEAHRERHDILANVQTLESAWNGASPAQPLTIELVGSVLPELNAGKSPARGLRATAVVDKTNFQELRPILEDIRDLILESDGSGYGRLRRSGYEAQPADPGKNFWAGSRDNEPGFNHVGPAKLVPGPATL